MNKFIFVFYLYIFLTGPWGWANTKSPTVAVLYTKSGDETEQFENLLEVAKFALTQYNSIYKKNYSFNFVEVDDKGSPSSADNQMKTLAIKEKPMAIIGPLYSNIAMSMKEYVTLNEIPMISVFATHNDLTHGTKFIFRVCSSNNQLADNLINHIFPIIRKNKLNVSVFKDLSDSYSTDLADTFGIKLTKIDSQIKINEVVFRGITGLDHLKDINSKVWAPSKKDILFLATQDNVSSHILTAMEAEPFLVAAIEPVNFLEIIQKVKKNKMHVRLTSTAQWLPGKSPLSKKVEAAFKIHFHRDMQISSALTFDAVFALIEGYSQSLRKKIPLEEALRLPSKLKGVTGKLAFGPDGERVSTETFFRDDILE